MGIARLGRALLVDLIQQAVEQQPGVALALAQRGDLDDGNGEAVEQVLPEASRGDLGGEVAVGGGEDADIDLDRGGGADPGDLALLEAAQELDLGGPGQLADFVQKERAGVGGLEVAPALGVGAGEGAFLVAEQLGLHQVRGYGAAVGGDEGALAAGAGLVEGAGQEFLAGAGFALDQDRDGPGRDPPGAGYDALHRRAAVDDVRELRGHGDQAGGQALQFPVGAGEKVREEVGADVEGD